MLTTITKGSYDNTPIPDNVYLAKLQKVVEKAPPAAHPDWYPSFSWRFQILQEPFKNRIAFGKTPTNWVSQKKLDNWLIAVGINATKGQSVKIEDIKDLYVKILVKGKKYTDKQTGEEKIFSEVTELLPLDSLDQIKIRELIAGINTVAGHTNVIPQQPAQPTIAPSNPVFTGGYVPITTTVPVPTVSPVTVPTFTPAPNVTQPTPTFTPNVPGGPSRTIPF